MASWAVGFEKLLNDEMGLYVFTEFLKKEFSQENIQFWIACEKYKKLSDAEEVCSFHRLSPSIVFFFFASFVNMPI